MEINTSKLLGFLTGLLIILGVLGSGYVLYTVFFTGDEVEVSPSLNSINPNLFGPKTQKAASMLVDKTQQVSLDPVKDISFIKGSLYNSFTDVPEVVPLSTSRGRSDPFLPADDTYVAP